MPNLSSPTTAGLTFTELINVVGHLRSTGGCTWDRAQTRQSLRAHFLEEVYEVLDAMDADDPSALKEELGDLLIHIAFQSDIGCRADEFDAYEVVTAAVNKLHRRHPHVFDSNQSDLTATEVELQWEARKRLEQGRRSILKNMPKELPALAAATTVTGRIKSAVPDWTPTKPIAGDSSEPHNAAAQVPVNSEQNAGRFLLQVAYYMAQADIDPESALRSAVRELDGQVRKAESEAGRALDEFTPTERAQFLEHR